MKNSRENKQSNPELLHNRAERQSSSRLYENYEDWDEAFDDYEFGSMLYPDYFRANAASGTEATGLIQSVPVSNAELASYFAVYNYCMPKPIVQEEDD